MGHWFPKLTPYRFLIISTTIGLGTAKAYATAKGLSFIATSIEWVASVVVFSIIFILGLFEAKPPHHLSWFMESDLVTIFFHLLSLTPPQYHTDEVPDYKLDHVGHLPPMSGYQIMTILAVSTFGVVKAYLSYREVSQGANAVDWVLGVIITSCLYILGLYEKNPNHSMPYLFSTDYSSTVYRVSLVVVNFVLIILFSTACVFWYHWGGLTDQEPWPSVYPPTPLIFVTVLLSIERCWYYTWLFALEVVVLCLSALLFRPVWYYPSLRRLRASMYRKAVLVQPFVEENFDRFPRWVKKAIHSFIVYLSIFGKLGLKLIACTPWILLGGYIILSFLFAIRFKWVMSPDSLAVSSGIYIFTIFILFFLSPSFLAMFFLSLACHVYLISSIAFLFQMAWKRSWFQF